jgi:hypothetical protein
VLPPWAAEIADRDAAGFVESIRASQVRIVGDLDKLAAKSPSAPWHDIADIPVRIAAEAVAGAILAGQKARRDARKELAAAEAQVKQLKTEVTELRKERDLRVKQATAASPGAPGGRGATERVEQVAASFSTHEIAAGLKRRLIYRLRTRRSHPVDRAR